MVNNDDDYSLLTQNLQRMEKVQWMQQRRPYTQHHTVMNVIESQPENGSSRLYRVWGARKAALAESEAAAKSGWKEML